AAGFSTAGFSAALAGLAATGGAAERFFSTTTALVRPWLKLCLTVDVSVFFSDSVLAGRLVSSVSLMNLFRYQGGLNSGSRTGVPHQRSNDLQDRPAGRR